MEAWAKRQSDPVVIDSIGIFETIALAVHRFNQCAVDYMQFRDAATKCDSDEFTRWLRRSETSRNIISRAFGKGYMLQSVAIARGPILGSGHCRAYWPFRRMPRFNRDSHF